MDGLLATKSEGEERRILSVQFVFKISNLCGRRQTTCNRNTALCPMHRAVIII